MAEYKKIKDHNGTTRYMKDGKLVAGANIPPDARETLNASPDGTVVDDEGNTVEDGDGLEGVSKKSDGNNPDTQLDEDEDESDEDESEDESDEEPEDDEPGTDSDEPEDEPEDDSDEAPTGAPIAPTPAAAKKLKADRARKRAVKKDKVLPGQTPQSDPGMGFPRVNGKTVDIFDGKTPHTHVRLVQGVMVPLSKANYEGDPEKGIEPKTDTEILTQLKKLGMF